MSSRITINDFALNFGAVLGELEGHRTGSFVRILTATFLKRLIYINGGWQRSVRSKAITISLCKEHENFHLFGGSYYFAICVPSSRSKC